MNMAVSNIFLGSFGFEFIMLFANKIPHWAELLKESY